MNDLCFETARGLARRIRAREVSAVEVLHAHVAQIERTNGAVNAIVTRSFEQAEADARRIDAQLGRGEDPGPLAGLPVAHKDLVQTRGVRTTFGSPLFADFVPEADAAIVERLKAAGAVSVRLHGKGNIGARPVAETIDAILTAIRERANH